MTEHFYKFNVGQLPDELFHQSVPVKEWLKTTTTAGKDGFPTNSLNKIDKIPRLVEMERIVGVSLYMIGNVLPFLLPSLSLLAFFSTFARMVLYFVLSYVAILMSVENFFFKPRFLKLYHRGSGQMTDNIRDNQYLFTERNNVKYLSVNYVWPKSLQRPRMESKPMIFCAVPHGVAPFGATAYPVWSKVWNDKLCRWTCAPVVLKLPLVGYFLDRVGYIPAKSKPILETLIKKEQNVGVFLDGIAGMFQPRNREVAYLKKRKGIVKIALRAGAPIVPVYAFGHTALYTVVVDPLGILQWMSLQLETSFTPFFGRFGWFLGPPARKPVAVCLGEPVMCPQVAEPTKEQIDTYHRKLLDAYQELFDKHKAAYGWGEKELHFV